MKNYVIRDCLSVEEFRSYMDGWCNKKPGFVTVTSIGKSGGYDILKAVFTDPSVPDDDKQVVLLTAQHSMELSGVTTLLSVGNFLVSDREDAAEILKKVIVVIIPCSNAYSYSKQDPAYQFKNEAGICEYFSFNYNGVAYDEATAPVAHAIKRVLDEYRPEVMLDVHGVCYRNQLVVPSMGVSGSAGNRFYNNEFVRQVQSAAVESGYPVMNFDDMEVLLRTDMNCDDRDINGHFYVSNSNLHQAQVYTYLHYHTLAGSFETAFEDSCVPQIIRALSIGCKVWNGEHYSGYPTRTVVSNFGHNTIRAYGNTAAMRRESRAELWKHRSRIFLGVGHPEMPGLDCAIICTDPSVAQNVAEHYELMNDSIEKMSALYDVDKGKMLEILRDEYPQHMEYYAYKTYFDGEGPLEIKQGMTVRMGLPFADASNYTVFYNGHELFEDELDGYTVTKCNNWTYVDMNIPAHKICPFAIAMVKYDCTVPKQGIIEF